MTYSLIKPSNPGLLPGFKFIVAYYISFRDTIFSNSSKLPFSSSTIALPTAVRSIPASDMK